MKNVLDTYYHILSFSAAKLSRRLWYVEWNLVSRDDHPGQMCAEDMIACRDTNINMLCLIVIRIRDLVQDLSDSPAIAEDVFTEFS